MYTSFNIECNQNDFISFHGYVHRSGFVSVNNADKLDVAQPLSQHIHINFEWNLTVLVFSNSSEYVCFSSPEGSPTD